MGRACLGVNLCACVMRCLLGRGVSRATGANFRFEACVIVESETD